MPKKPTRRRRLSPKDVAHRRRLRRDPFGRLAVALGDYLETVGWRAIVVGRHEIRGPDGAPFNYEFVIKFTGGEKKTPAPPEGTMVNAGTVK
jgi:hypothetical protein